MQSLSKTPSNNYLAQARALLRALLRAPLAQS